MGKISNAVIKREMTWYNPMFIKFGNTYYEVGNFVLYDPCKGEVIAETKRGWFDETPSFEYMEYSDMELCNKVDLTIKHPFFVRVKNVLSAGERAKACVYIPSDVLSVNVQIVKALAGSSVKYRLTDVMLKGGYETRVREFVETITTPAYDKRETIAKKCNMDSYTLNGILKVLRDEGYDVNDIISD